MERAFTGIDHAVIVVRDVDAAAAAFERLGFIVTPKSGHPELGSENRCIIMHGDYIELLCPGDHPETRYFKDFLAEREGMAALAARSTDIERTRTLLARQNLKVCDTLSFSRPLTLANGEDAVARFSVGMLEPGQTEGFTLFGCQHHTADLVWSTGYEHHANQAERMSAILFAAESVPRSGRLFERYFDTMARGGQHDSLELKTGDVPVFVIPCTRLEERYPGVTGHLTKTGFIGLSIQVMNIAETARVLTANGVPFSGGSALHLLVAPAYAHGVMIEFYSNANKL